MKIQKLFKITLLIIIMVLIKLNVEAQITLDLNVAQEYFDPTFANLVDNPEAIMLTVINTSPESQEYKISFKLYKDGEIIGETRDDELASRKIEGSGVEAYIGDEILNPKTVESYVDYKSAWDAQIIPAGYYKLCMTALDVDTDEPLGKEVCRMIIVTQLDNIRLLTPRNEAKISSLEEEIFSWTPVIKPDGNPVIYYFKIVKMEEDQSPFEALEYNPPLYDVKLIDLTTEDCWPAAKDMDFADGTKLAWSVQALNEETGKPYGPNQGWADLYMVNISMDDQKKIKMPCGFTSGMEKSTICKNNIEELMITGVGMLSTLTGPILANYEYRITNTVGPGGVIHIGNPVTQSIALGNSSTWVGSHTGTIILPISFDMANPSYAYEFDVEIRGVGGDATCLPYKGTHIVKVEDCPCDFNVDAHEQFACVGSAPFSFELGTPSLNNYPFDYRIDNVQPSGTPIYIGGNPVTSLPFTQSGVVGNITQTMNFTQIGTYTFDVTITDPLGHCPDYVKTITVHVEDCPCDLTAVINKTSGCPGWGGYTLTVNSNQFSTSTLNHQYEIKVIGDVSNPGMMKIREQPSIGSSNLGTYTRTNLSTTKVFDIALGNAQGVYKFKVDMLGWDKDYWACPLQSYNFDIYAENCPPVADPNGPVSIPHGPYFPRLIFEPVLDVVDDRGANMNSRTLNVNYNCCYGGENYSRMCCEWYEDSLRNLDYYTIQISTPKDTTKSEEDNPFGPGGVGLDDPLYKIPEPTKEMNVDFTIPNDSKERMLRVILTGDKGPLHASKWTRIPLSLDPDKVKESNPKIKSNFPNKRDRDDLRNPKTVKKKTNKRN